MASSTARPALHAIHDENTENVLAGKPALKPARAHVDAARRSILRDLTPNTSISSRQSLSQSTQASGKKSMPNSPLKRTHRDVLGEDKGFRYLKRRRLSQGEHIHHGPLFKQDKPPLSPPSSGRHIAAAPMPTQGANETAAASAPAPEKDSDEDSGRESQNSNNTRGSFSSLINYDPSSQQALASQALNYVNIPPSVSAHTTHTPARYSSSLSNTIRAHAEMLRLRLRVAIYKVRTNQINVPFSRLRAPATVNAPESITKVHAHPPQTTEPFQSPALTVGEDLPAATRGPNTSGNDESLPYGLGLSQLPDMNKTPNVYSNRFMPLQRAPSSSPPFIQMPPSSLPRNTMTRDTPLMGRISHDHDSLDSEATELAEDMHEGGDERSLHAESPSQAGHARRHISMFSTALPR